MLSAVAGFSQWNPNTFQNLEVSALNGDDLETATTSDGKTWVAFYSYNDGNYDMRVQLLDVSGNKLLGPDGMAVSTLTSGSATFVFNVCVDANNSLIIGYQYEAAGVLNALITKVNTNGTLPWGDGVILGEGLSPYPAINKTNDVVVCWNNNSPSTLYLQKISSSGSTMWGSPVAINVGTSNTTRGQIVCHSNGDFTTVFQRRSFGISTTLYAQRYSTNGVALWAAPLQLCNETTSGARYYSVLADGNTAYCGYYSSVGFRFNSHLQKIPASGTLPWGINGASFSTYSSSSDPSQQTTYIAKTAGSPFIWASCTYIDPGQTQYGVFVQKFDTTSGMAQLNPLGKEVFPISSTMETQAGGLALYNDAPIFAVYDLNYKIYATRLDNAGDFVWTGNRIELSSTTASTATPKGRFSFTSCVNSQAVAVWSENRGVEYRAYAQAINAFGTLPVSLIDFSGVKNNNSTLLFWTTGTENGCLGFDLERSTNGKDFIKIGFIKSMSVNGNSNTYLNYTYTDVAPFAGKNYYRLKQVDLDGKFFYSSVLNFEFNNKADWVVENIYPNPAHHFTAIKISAAAKYRGEILVYDLQGKLVKRSGINWAAGENIINFNIEGLQRGVYQLKVTAGNLYTTTKTLFID